MLILFDTPPIIHRDIKPQNLKINSRRRIKLLDFGIAKSVETGATSTTQTFVGATLEYSPIEQLLRVIDPTFREFILLKHKVEGETEAEWEYAARAGTTGNYAGNLDEMAWYNMDENTGHPYDVATKKPNAWGLYDMHGNVSEWVNDWFEDKYYTKSPATDPPGPSSTGTRTIRGGAWVAPEHGVRSAKRMDGEPSVRSRYLGFRVVREK